MTTTTPVPLPVGAVSAEDWQHDAGRPYRCFQGEIRESPTDNQFGETIVGVYTYGIQHDDGTIEDGTTDRFLTAPAFLSKSAARKAGRSRASPSARKQLVNSLIIW
jgi:hypothetical protein